MPLKHGLIEGMSCVHLNPCNIDSKLLTRINRLYEIDLNVVENKKLCQLIAAAEKGIRTS